jgi:hypothetical protein
MRDQVIQKYLLIFSALYAEQDLLLMERESSTWKRHPMAVYMVVPRDTVKQRESSTVGSFITVVDTIKKVLPIALMSKDLISRCYYLKIVAKYHILRAYIFRR